MTSAASAAACAASAAALAASVARTSSSVARTSPSVAVENATTFVLGASAPAAAPEIDVEDLVIAYLAAQNIVTADQISGRVPPTLPTPFVLVQRVAGGDDLIVDYSTVSVHSFGSTQTAASDAARAIHHAMRQLRPKTAVTMPDGSTVYPYGPTITEQTPIYLEWEPAGSGLVIFRYVARYLVNLRLPSIAAF